MDETSVCFVFTCIYENMNLHKNLPSTRNSANEKVFHTTRMTYT